MNAFRLLQSAGFLLVLAAQAASGAAGKLSLSENSPVVLTEDRTLTPSVQITVNRTEGTDGTVTAQITAATLGSLTPVSADYPPFHYRFTPESPWVILPWGGNIPLTFGDGVSSLAVEVEAIDNDAWEGVLSVNSGGVPGSLKLENISSPAVAGDKVTRTVRINGNDPAPVMTITPLSAAEGNGGGTVTRYVSVSLDRAIARRSVQYLPEIAAPGTATLNTDYWVPNTEPSFPFTLSPYVQQFQVPVTFHADADTEPDESFTLRITLTASTLPGSGLLTLTGEVPVTILHDEFPEVTIGAASVAEGNAGSASLVFPVSVASALPARVSFAWATVSSADPGRATAGEDFTAASGTVEIPAGTTTAAITVLVNGDAAVEPDETLLLSLSAPHGLSLPEAMPAGTILDDDGPRIRIESASVDEGNSGTSLLVFPVTLTTAQAAPVSFDWTTVGGGPTTAGVDFVSASGTVVIPAGSTSASVEVVVKGDTQVEGDELLALALSNGSGVTLPPPPQWGTILNDDFPVLTLLPFMAATETDAPQAIYARFLLSEVGSQNASVKYTVNAPPGTVSPMSGTLQFPFPSAYNVLEFTFPGDNLPEEDREVTITFSDPVGLLLSGGATFKIFDLYDDDRPTLTVSGGSVTEGNDGTGNLPFSITLSEPMAQDVSFHFATGDGTATAGQDYTASSGEASIPAGATTATVSVVVSGDTQIEVDETISLTLSEILQPVNHGVDTPATILTDEFPPGPAPTATLVTEASGADTAHAWFAVDLSAPRTTAASCQVSTRNGTALAGSDYNVLAPTTITFAPGETRKWVAITVTASPEAESKEEFFLDVEALDSHEIKSAACTVERLAVTDFWRAWPGIFAIRFPTGLGQRYIIDEAAELGAPWAPASSILTGTGSSVTQLMFSQSDSGFFRVRSAPALPPGTPSAGS